MTSQNENIEGGNAVETASPVERIVRPKFGDKVKYSNILRRYSRGRTKFWKPERKPGEGIWLGYRTLSNGDVYHDEDGAGYTPKEWQKAALICTNSKENPFYVPAEDIEA